VVHPLVDLSLLTAPTAAGASLVAERLTYTPGATFSVQRHTQIRVISLEAGALDARIDGVGFLDRRWPAGSLLARESDRVVGVVHLHPGDLLVVPAEAAFTVRNVDELPAVSLDVSVQRPSTLTPMTVQVSSATGSESVHREHLAGAIATDPGISAAVAVARITLLPGESFLTEEISGSVFVVGRGLFSATRDGMDVDRAPGDAQLVSPRERATLRSSGKDPLAVLLVKVTPLESDPSAN
jgi:mannose-6-phosphate isomerase-like protein (cupin superfamily)